MRARAAGWSYDSQPAVWVWLELEHNNRLRMKLTVRGGKIERGGLEIDYGR